MSISANSLLACPQLVESIDPVCEVLTLAGARPPHGTSNATRYVGQLGMMQTFSSPAHLCQTRESVVQYASQLLLDGRPAWQGSDKRVVVNFCDTGVWPKSSVLAINEMLLGVDLSGRVVKKMNEPSSFYPLDPSGTGMFLADILCEQGYASKDDDNQRPRVPMLKETDNVNFIGSGAYVGSPVSPCLQPLSPLIHVVENSPVTYRIAYYPVGSCESCRVLTVERGPWKFNVQFHSQLKRLKDLRKILNNSQCWLPYPVDQLEVGSCLVVRRSLDGMLHRAIVSNGPVSGNVAILYVDTGENDRISCENVFKPTPELGAIPVLCTRCNLAGIPEMPEATLSNAFHKIVSSSGATFIATVTRVMEKLQKTCVSIDVCFPSSISHSMLDLISQPEYKQVKLTNGDKVLVAHHDSLSAVVFVHLVRNLNLVCSRSIFSYRIRMTYLYISCLEIANNL